MNSAAIGFSGGADSTFLLKVASEILGKKVLAITVNFALIKKCEIDLVQDIAKDFKIKHIIIDIDFEQISELRDNKTNRCYYCKREMFKKIIAIAKEENKDFVLDGSNFDDLKDFRPGIKALKELGVRSPLLEAGLTKHDIEILAEKIGIKNYIRSPSACLASRIPYGIKITMENIKSIEKAERLLNSVGIKNPHVRYHKDIARIEVAKKDFQIILKNANQIVEKFKNLGFNYVTLDLEGYRTGSLNEVL
ncbi:MAG: ATP-dependent sacrificial sulfur transferase LarE [Candidatus Thermoplasmatota archaeon]|nr:ATP-dependent sacrificial sulfur transferase LarE [Candidatus Thermoplasmatota archaeon]